MEWGGDVLVLQESGCYFFLTKCQVKGAVRAGRKCFLTGLPMQDDQCDQMPKMFVQYLAIYSSVNWAKSTLNFPKVGSKVCQILPN